MVWGRRCYIIKGMLVISRILGDVRYKYGSVGFIPTMLEP